MAGASTLKQVAKAAFFKAGVGMAPWIDRKGCESSCTTGSATAAIWPGSVPTSAPTARGCDGASSGLAGARCRTPGEWMIGGIGVFYPDGKPTQRVGIIPDVPVRPTIAGIRAGQDEVQDAAVRLIQQRLLEAGH
jgi:hypothetical protein